LAGRPGLWPGLACGGTLTPASGWPLPGWRVQRRRSIKTTSTMITIRTMVPMPINMGLLLDARRSRGTEPRELARQLGAGLHRVLSVLAVRMTGKVFDQRWVILATEEVISQRRAIGGSSGPGGLRAVRRLAWGHGRRRAHVQRVSPVPACAAHLRGMRRAADLPGQPVGGEGGRRGVGEDARACCARWRKGASQG
jgi:hypothetical protein